MEKLVIEASPPLRGSVKVDGAKNSVLPIMAAALLTPGPCVINDIPDLSDAAVMEEILNYLGASTTWNKAERSISIKANKPIKTDAPYELVSQMRASFLITGPLLARRGTASIPLPGGCAIGARPIELHLKGFAAMGADIVKEHGFVSLNAKQGLVGAKIYLFFPGVGATENIMMAATIASGQTIIENCAVEPEIVDLANFLNAIGGDIRGAGTDTIKINGV
ncbi:MAG: UDP-N-acetylglucosamine 1-carboxyvinyltransferase, partial [Defluviitaleaceae bacterium]|nr:UDP-N-acetylglucosamine 1-carboxyvinyltransferase [Defluviitaleaceae bacterium]